MEYRFTRRETAAIFILVGRIDAAGALRLSTALKEHLTPGDRAVLIDLAGVAYMSSAGIRVFVGLKKTLQERQGHLLLCSVQPAVLKILGITGFDRIFSVCPTLDDAIRRCLLAEGPGEFGNQAQPEGARTRLSAESFPANRAILKITGSAEKLLSGNLTTEDLVPRIVPPSEYSLGIGKGGDSAEESFPDPEILLTTGNAIFWKPIGSTDPPDFLIPGKDAPRILLNCTFSIAVDDTFHEVLVAEPVRPEGFSVSDLFTDILAHAKATRKDCPPVISVVLYAGISDLAGNPDGDGNSPRSTTTGHLSRLGSVLTLPPTCLPMTVRDSTGSSAGTGW